jgi:general secretion pathway protein D
MKKTLFFCLLIVLFVNQMYAQDESHHVLQDKIAENGTKKPSHRRASSPLISMYFNDEDLIDIINFLASEKGVNVVLPMGTNAINSKVTLHLEEKVTIDEAWDILYTLLDLAGYSMIAKDQTYNIVKTTPDVNREALPLYIVKPEEIPNVDKRIRYLYYFTNMKIMDERNSEINNIIVEVLSATPTSGTFKLDAQTNSVFLSDKASNIRGLMQIISALDQMDAQEKPEIIQLRYVSADTVAQLFDSILQGSQDLTQQRLGIKMPNNSTYFKKVRIIREPRTNRLIIFGRQQAIERVRDFIHKYIDIELESGKSILHVYQLQYLDASSFAPVLDKIVKSERAGGTEQSRAGKQVGGPDRFFDEVIIRADRPETVSGEQPGTVAQGSNNLIIAARNDDYERIKKVIEELDTPQLLVIIEVLIADLTLQDIASLGMSVRNPLGLGLSDRVNFQSAQVSDFLTNSTVNPSTIQADLLRRAYDQNCTLSSNCNNAGPDQACFSAATCITQGQLQGTALLSLNDAATGQTWGLGQVRKLLRTDKVLSHPHLISMNNQEAVIYIKEERLAIDQGSGSTGGTTTQTRRWIPAVLSVNITPRIFSEDMVNLKVVVDINQFETPASSFTNTGPNAANTANQITRNVTTNANVRSGGVLALGGLTRVDTTVEESETPFLSKIPIIGWLFKDRTNTINKNNLTVFISPTIVQPRLRGGVSNYTRRQVQLAKSYSREGALFDGLRDPITRWFFKTQRDDAETDLDDFLAQDEFIAPTIFDSRRERKIVVQGKEKNDTPVAKIPAESTIVIQKKSMPDIAPKSIDSAVTVAAKPKSDLKTLVADAQNPFEKITPSAKA